MLLETEAKNLFALLNPRLVPGAGLVIQFIAATPGEGTSTLSRDFALVASRHTRYPVLLLNLDLNDSAHEQGFGDLVRQPADTVDPLARPAAIDAGLLYQAGGHDRDYRLDFIATGNSALYYSRLRGYKPDALYLANSPDFWSAARERFVLTIVDSPPASASFDGISVSGSMDAVVIVVAAEATRAPVVASLSERLRAQDAPLIGTVLNKRRFYIPQRVYQWLERL